MPTTLGSIRIPDEVLSQYDDGARATGRSRNGLMIDDPRDVISAQAWFVVAVKRGVAAAKRSDFVPAAGMDAHWERWTGG